MSEERNEQGWRIEATEFMNFANCSRRGREIEVSVEAESVEINVEEGSGYLSQRTTAYIPMEIMVVLMRNAGYTVTRG